MKSGVVPIVLRPDIIPEYMLMETKDEKGNVSKVVNNAGIWTDNFYDIPLLIGDVLVKFLDDMIPDDIYIEMNKVAAKYSHENAEKKLQEIYGSYIDQRILLMENALKPNQEPKKDNSTVDTPTEEDKQTVEKQ